EQTHIPENVLLNVNPKQRSTVMIKTTRKMDEMIAREMTKYRLEESISVSPPTTDNMMVIVAESEGDPLSFTTTTNLCFLTSLPSMLRMVQMSPVPGEMVKSPWSVAWRS
uniref:Uncharacterized protein n=1 Tax=Callorhinchus milii TaxID=7868 RepID=A0A4W3KA39_CALMI